MAPFLCFGRGVIWRTTVAGLNVGGFSCSLIEAFSVLFLVLVMMASVTSNDVFSSSLKRTGRVINGNSER